ncbi:hypothetical protein V6N11_044045 [Hibiscus sabdariffa]|uniref:RNase H type-1 domain-containing protein n=1 Tax=Hibiscus sabdariffa TaxID=183260 RepID=A0ABR2RE25_9ROSI
MTNVERCHQNLSFDPSCLDCSSPLETTIHVMQDCHYARHIWLKILPVALFRPFFTLNLQQWLSCNLTATIFHPQWKVSWRSLFASLTWQIWKRRNDLIFHNPVLTDASIIDRSLAWVKYYSDSVELDKVSPLYRDQRPCKQVVDLVNSPFVGSSVLSLVLAIHRLQQKSWTTIVSWIPRDDNRPADALAKLVSPSDFSLHVYPNPPMVPLYFIMLQSNPIPEFCN